MWTRLVALFSRLGFAWARRRLDQEARAELDAHLDLLVDRYIRSGLTPGEAHTAARRQFGNVTLAREKVYRMNGIGWIDGLSQDVGYAFRQLRRNPGFSSVVVATLALGIGGTTAMFSVVQSVLLAPLAYEQPGRLVRIYQQEPGDPGTRFYLTAAHFTHLRERAGSFSDVAALHNYSETGLDLVRDGQAQRLRVLQVTSGYFRTLGAQGLRGDEFNIHDETGTPRVVISDALWRARFAADPSVIGTTIRLNAEPYEVAGIAPDGFEDPIVGDIDAWLPYELARDTSEQNNSLSAVGRLRSGVTVEQARAELAAISQQLKERWRSVRRSAIVALPLQEDLVAGSRGVLQLLLIAVVLVLLIACVNVGNLMLVRATGRVQEFAIRAALGSGRRRIFRQLLVESALLASLGGLLGLVLASAGVEVLKDLGRDAITRLDEVGFDPAVLGFAALVTLLTVVAFGVAPALRFAAISPNLALRQQSRSSTGTRSQGRIRSGLAALQLALALTLLVGAGVLLASFRQLQQVNLGFRVERVLTFDVSLPSARYDAARRAAFQEDLARRIAAIPGVQAAGGTSRFPATGSYHPWITQIETGPLAGTPVRRTQQRTVSGDFFRALEIPLRAGRTFDARDAAGVPLHTVVSASLAKQAFPGVPLEQVVGQRVVVAGERREVVGVVGDVTLDVYGMPAMVLYHPHRQIAGNRNWALSQVVATELPPERILSAVRGAVADMDRELVVYRVAPMTEVVGRSSSRERFALVLMGTFATVSLMLATLGLYGVLAYAVRQRTQEIGIRLALGATAGQVRTLVLRQATIVLAAGLGVGVLGALALGRWLTSLVYQISPWDPRIILATTALLSITGLLAACLPAWRASRVPPGIAMQEGN